MYRSSLLTTVFAAALLGACSNTDLIKQTEQTTPTGSDFAKSTYKEYLELGKSEEAQGDRSSAKHYLTKARLAASGKEVGPDDPALRDIAGPEEAPIKAGYAQLKTALESGAGQRKPIEAAKAQAMLDCWAEQSEEGFQPDDIRACRTGFETALAALGERATSAEKVPSGPYTVNFKFNSVDLTDKSQAEMDRILEKVGADKSKPITVTAYTDLAGDQKYNEALSAKRAAALKSKLEAAGATSVIATGKGATDPVVQTQKASMPNRRAVISFE
jgi:OOP family OmpA-OmpF porin